VFYLAVIILCLSACKMIRPLDDGDADVKSVVSTEDLASDPLRPRFHLLPARNWMNDPSGPIFTDGTYHLFFQYNPHGSVWGTMHWAHATSPDMIHWQHQPVAIAPTKGTFDEKGVFSGHVVIADDGTPTMFYTGVAAAKTPDEVTLHDGISPWAEVQGRAISRDGLKTWIKDKEPVLANPPFPASQISGWRDPLVWREGQSWQMIVGSGFLGKGPAVFLYKSSDLIHWNYAGILAEGKGTGEKTRDPVDNEEMWECPDFFKLGDQYVLVYGTRRKVYWKSGDLVNGKFVAKQGGPVDYGSFYGARSMLDKNGKRILWGWIPETRKDVELKAAGWAGLMALPRELGLDDDGNLVITPAPIVNSLREGHIKINLSSAEARQKLAEARITDLSADIVLELSDDSKPLSLTLLSADNRIFAQLNYQPARRGKELSLNSSAGSFRAVKGKAKRIRLIVDGSAIEAFLGDAAITERVYVKPESPLHISVSDLSALKSIDLWHMKAISADRLTH